MTAPETPPDGRTRARREVLEDLAEHAERVAPSHGEPTQEGGSSGGLVVRPFSEIEPDELRWLWPERIPLAKVSLLFGDPGLGKSLATIGLASAVSRGGRLPDGSHAPLGSALLLSAEDDPADTVRPRLDAAGANVAKVHVVQVEGGWFDLSADQGALEAEIERLGDVRLVVVDPVSAYLGGTDSHKNAEIRGLIGPLTEVAGRTGAAIVLVTHLNKGGGNKAIYRATGSLAFVAAARSAWAVVRDAQLKDRCLFLPAKSNLGAPVPGLAYRVEEGSNGAPVLAWEAEPVDESLDQAMAAEVGAGGGPGGATKRPEAAEWLERLLADGGRLVREVMDEATAAGFSIATIRRAAADLGIVRTKEGFRGPWRWSLRCEGAQSLAKAPRPGALSTFAEGEHLGREGVENAEAKPCEERPPSKGAHPPDGGQLRGEPGEVSVSIGPDGQLRDTPRCAGGGPGS